MQAASNKDAALSLVNRGLRVFPCTPEKTPLVKDWENAASSSPFFIGAKWDATPDALPAIPTGAQAMVVIDLDRKPNGPDGVAAFLALCAEQAIDLSSAFAVETPSRGIHLYFRTDAAYSNSRGSLPDGVDVRGVGGYVIAPGTVLPDGRSYRHVAGSWDAIPALPEALAVLLREKRCSAPAVLPESRLERPVTERERAFASAALADEVAKLTAMREGQGRNRALNEAAFALATMDRWIDLNDVAYRLLDAATVNGYVAKDGEEAAKRTIASGLVAGQQHPRPLLSSPEHVEAINIRPMIDNAIAAYKAKHSVVSSAKRSVTLIFGTEIEERAITWLWDQYLPMGSLILIAGAGGVGKSTITCDIAGRVTNGATWPDGSPCRNPGKVLIWSSEDDAARVIKPRLSAAGANPQNYAIIGPIVDVRGESCPFDPARDMDVLRDAVEQIGGISLLIIDPIVSAVTGDMNKVNEVRRNLQSIVDFAANMNCAVMGVTHFAKGTAGRNASERVIGSTAFKDLSRVTLAVAKDEETGEHVMTRAKSNYSSEGGGFSFGIEVIRLRDDITANRVQWGRELKGSSRAILAAVENDEKQDGDKMRAAKQFLIEALGNGPIPSKEVLKMAREGYGITEDTLRRAYKEIGIKPFRVGFGKDGQFMWSLPLANPLQSHH